MFEIVRFGLLFLSLVFTTPTWAVPGSCTNLEPDSIGSYMSPEILPEVEVRKAIACAVNRSGYDVIGESSFRPSPNNGANHLVGYDLSIDEDDLHLIRVIRQRSLEPPVNQRNVYKARFRAIFQDRIFTLVRCNEVTVQFQKIPTEHVMVTLNDCSANAVGPKPNHPMRAWVIYTPVRK